MVLKKLGIYIQKIKMNPYFIAYIKINSKWIDDLNVWSEIVRLPKENTEEKSLDNYLGNDFLDMTPKTQTLVSPLCYDSTEDTQNNLQFVGKKSNRSLVIISLYSEGHRLSLGDKKVEFLQLFSNRVIWSSASFRNSGSKFVLKREKLFPYFNSDGFGNLTYQVAERNN